MNLAGRRQVLLVSLGTLTFAILMAAAVGWWILSRQNVPQSWKCDMTGGLQWSRWEEGAVQRSGVVDEKSPVGERVKQIVEDRSRRWTMSLITYAPAAQFSGRNFSLILQDDLAILNYKNANDGRSRQLVRTLSPEEHREVEEILRAVQE
jgi:hypothetical protein